MKHHSIEQRQAGPKQGITVVMGIFLPILAIVSLFPAVPAMIDHFAGDASASWKVPALVSAPGLSIAALALFIGILIDRFGRRLPLLIATLFYALFGTIPFFLDDLNAIYISRLALGVAEAVLMVALNTLLADYWSDRQRRNWLTIQGLGAPLLASFVILGSGYVTEWRWNGIFLLYLIAVPIFFAMLAWLYEPPREARVEGGSEGRSTSFPLGIGLWIAGVTIFSSTLYYIFIVNGGLAFREVGIVSSAELGRITALPSLFVVVGTLLFWLVGKRPHRTQLALFLLVMGSGLALIGWAPDWRWMVGGLVIQQIGAGMAIPTMIAWTQAILPFEHRGRGIGVWTACFYLGQFSSPLVVSLIRAQLSSMQGAFVAIGLIGMVGGLIIFALMRGRPAALTPGELN